MNLFKTFGTTPSRIVMSMARQARINIRALRGIRTHDPIIERVKADALNRATSVTCKINRYNCVNTYDLDLVGTGHQDSFCDRRVQLYS
jgi:hypothetical protein